MRCAVFRILSRSTRVRFLILFWFPFRTVRRAARRGPTKTCRSSPGPSDIPCFGSPLHFFAWADSQWPDRTGRRYHSVLVSLPDFLAPGRWSGLVLLGRLRLLAVQIGSAAMAEFCAVRIFCAACSANDHVVIILPDGYRSLDTILRNSAS